MTMLRHSYFATALGLLLMTKSPVEPPSDQAPLPPFEVAPDVLDDGSPLPDVPSGEPYHPYLPPLDDRAISLGTTRDGALLRGAALPEDDSTLRVMPRQKARDLHYGTTGMVNALVAVAHTVAEAHPGSVLSLGDLSARNGGDIVWSVSHNTGRDADLAFYYRDRDGNYLVPEDFVTVNRKGIGADRRFVFDVERNWLLVKSLISHPEVQVQWLFIYRPLRDQLLRYARDTGEPEALLDRAAELLHQPTDGAPHDDHLHLRVMCSDADLGEGCQDMGRIPSGVRPPELVVAQRVDVALRYLQVADPERRARAAELLGILGARNAASELVALFSDPSPRVRVASARGLERLGDLRVTSSPLDDTGDDDGVRDGIDVARGSDVDPTLMAAVAAVAGDAGSRTDAAMNPGPKTFLTGNESWTWTLARHLELEQDPAVIEAWVGVLVRQGALAAVPLLERWLDDPKVFSLVERRDVAGNGLHRDTFPGLPSLASRGFTLDRPLPLRALAAAALGELESSAAVPRLIGLVKDPDPEVQRAAAWALEALFNQNVSAEDPEALARAYARWFNEKGSAGRDAWLSEGFRKAGYPVSSISVRSARSLVRALQGPSTVAWNAHRTLTRVTGARPPDASCSFEANRIYWERWLRKYGPPVSERSGKKLKKTVHRDTGKKKRTSTGSSHKARSRGNGRG